MPVLSSGFRLLFSPAGLGTVDKACEERYYTSYNRFILLLWARERAHTLAVFGWQSIVFVRGGWVYGCWCLRAEGKKAIIRLKLELERSKTKLTEQPTGTARSAVRFAVDNLCFVGEWLIGVFYVQP